MTINLTILALLALGFVTFAIKFGLKGEEISAWLAIFFALGFVMLGGCILLGSLLNYTN